MDSSFVCDIMISVQDLEPRREVQFKLNLYLNQGFPNPYAWSTPRGT